MSNFLNEYYHTRLSNIECSRIQYLTVVYYIRKDTISGSTTARNYPKLLVKLHNFYKSP